MIKLNHMALCTGSVWVICDKVNLLFSENADGFDMVISMCLKRAGLAGTANRFEGFLAIMRL